MLRTFIPYLYCLLCISSFPGCGKHETAQGLHGALEGAAIGASVTGKGDRAEGTLIGALIGGHIGRTAGADQDRFEKKLAHAREVTHLEHQLKKEPHKWCKGCGAKVMLKGAVSCPTCGHELFTEKFCRRCATNFEPTSHYQYCPYCPGGIRLKTA